MPVMNIATTTPLINNRLRQALPELMAVYSFGSQAQNNAGPDSDLDLAVLVAGYVDSVSLWQLGNKLANELDIDVDLLDLRAASTVMQYQILTGGGSASGRLAQKLTSSSCMCSVRSLTWICGASH